MTNLDIILGFRPRFLHFDLEDYAATYRVLPSDPSNEYYTLVQCCDSTPCTINGLPLRLVFSGKTSSGGSSKLALPVAQISRDKGSCLKRSITCKQIPISPGGILFSLSTPSLLLKMFKSRYSSKSWTGCQELW